MKQEPLQLSLGGRKTMGKYIFCLLLLSYTLFLGSCMSAGNMIFNDSAKKADTRMEQILEAIKANEKGAIEQLFSEQVLAETEDFEEKIACLFDVAQGEIKSWKRIGGPVKSERDEHGHRTIQICAWYDVETDMGGYAIMFRDCTVDTDNPDNVGLFMLNAVESDGTENLFESPIIGSYKAEEE